MNLIELVPRDIQQLLTEIKDIQSQFPHIDGVNIPDIKRIDNRSYDVAEILLDNNLFVVPHIRAMDMSIDQNLDMIDRLVKKGLTHILIVSGDLPESPIQKTHSINSVSLIQAVSNKFPMLNIYAALDPYRQPFEQELSYCKEKISAGAKGFFTQPFFEVSKVQEWLNALTQYEVYVGVSPVTSEGSYNYWKTRNHVDFPANFKLDFTSNCKLNSEILNLAISKGQHTYAMPIKESPLTYLEGLKSVQT